jgi:hypothetical protein
MLYKGTDLIKLLFYRRSEHDIFPFPSGVDFSG